MPAPGQICVFAFKRENVTSDGGSGCAVNIKCKDADQGANGKVAVLFGA